MIASMSLEQLCKPLDAQCIGENVSFTNLSTDTRSIQEGDLFVALKGENFDANEFAKQAQQKGACAAVVDTRVEGVESQLLVADSLQALGQIAAINRLAFNGPVIGLTGSVGKTSCKELLRSILSQAGNVLATQGNLNNEIGVPLTLMQIETEHSHAVIEMGAAQLGDIKYLADLVKPDVALVTCVEAAHLGRFGSMENIATTKAEIFSGLAEDGIAVINLDNEYTAAMQASLAGAQLITFSQHDRSASVYASDIEVIHSDDQPLSSFSFLLHASDQSVPVSLSVPGRHMIQNALAAASCAIAVGIELDLIASGLASFKAVDQRMSAQVGFEQALVIDDSYNANPASMRAAIDVLADQSGRRIFVMGEMGELGDNAVMLHAEIGEYARTKHIDYFCAVGDLCSHAVKAFGENGSLFSNKVDCSEFCRELLSGLDGSTSVLIKGSRSAGMEAIVESLLDLRGAA